MQTQSEKSKCNIAFLFIQAAAIVFVYKAGDFATSALWPIAY